MPKTVATCFSTSNIKEKLHLTVNNQPIPQEETPMYLGVKLYKKLTSNPRIKEMEKRATKRFSLVGWQQLGSQQQHPQTGLHKQCVPCDGIQSCSMGHSCQINSSRLAKLWKKGIRIITGELKPHPSLPCKLPLDSLSWTRTKKKVLIHSEKIKRLSAYAVSQHLQEPTKNRLKRNRLQPSCQKSCIIPCCSLAGHP